jgi:acetamidase/formamidase
VTLHTLEPDERTLIDHFDRDAPPVLAIRPGDPVRYRTLDAGWNLEPHSAPGKFAKRLREDARGHAMLGPVFVEGAHPGHTLEVTIDRLVPAAWGWTRSGGADEELYRRLGVAREAHWLLWSLDPQTGVATDQSGRTVGLRPFLGVMGNTPGAPGWHATAPPRPTGGNLDCRELVEGATLYLPVAVEGALFSCGDGHARQGDGEVSGTAIECPMDVAELTFTVRGDMEISTPWARTPDAWVTIGVGGNLDAAGFEALNAMLDLMQSRLDVPRAEALALASVVVDLRVTQIVNSGVVGVHAVLRDDALR